MSLFWYDSLSYHDQDAAAIQHESLYRCEYHWQRWSYEYSYHHNRIQRLDNCHELIRKSGYVEEV